MIEYWEERTFNRFDVAFLKSEFDRLLGPEFVSRMRKLTPPNLSTSPNKDLEPSMNPLELKAIEAVKIVRDLSVGKLNIVNAALITGQIFNLFYEAIVFANIHNAITAEEALRLNTLVLSAYDLGSK